MNLRSLLETEKSEKSTKIKNQQNVKIHFAILNNSKIAQNCGFASISEMFKMHQYKKIHFEHFLNRNPSKITSCVGKTPLIRPSRSPFLFLTAPNPIVYFKTVSGRLHFPGSVSSISGIFTTHEE